MKCRGCNIAELTSGDLNFLCPECTRRQNEPYTFTPVNTMGWQCPGCSRCYSPAITECPHCGPTLFFTGTTVTGVQSSCSDECLSPAEQDQLLRQDPGMCDKIGSGMVDPEMREAVDMIVKDINKDFEVRSHNTIRELQEKNDESKDN